VIIPETIIKDRYRIVRFLAKGGGGYVYEAYDLKHQRRVALKQLIYAQDFLQRAFVREAKRLAAMHHPAFPEVYEWFELKNNFFLVMEYIPGDDLRQALRKRPTPFPLERVMQWAFILLDALDYLHTFDPVAPIIHRDIKPENLKLNETNPIRRSAIILIDFGLSKGAGGNISQTSAKESVVGCTRHYAPPEQEFRYLKATGVLTALPERFQRFLHHPTNARSDLYSLGATLYTLLTNTAPRDSVERVGQMEKNEGDPLVPIHVLNDQVPDSISEIIGRAMNVEPEQRFASAAELSAALRTASHALHEQAGSPHVAPVTELPLDSTLTLETTMTRRQLPPESYPTQPAGIKDVKYGTLGKCEAAVRSVSFSLRGTHLASGGNDGAVRLWDVSTGEMTVLGYCHPGHTGLAYVSAVSFAPNGNSIASVSNDGAIRLWRVILDDQDNVRVLAVCQHPPRSIAFSPSGKHLVSGGSDGAVHLWDIATGVRTLLGNCQGVVWSVAVYPDGMHAAAESDDGTIRIWHLGSHHLETVQSFDADIRSIAVSPNGKLIAAAGRDCRIRIADVGASSMRDLAMCDGSIRSIAFSPDSSMVAVGGEDKLLRVCDVATGAMRTLGSCDDFISSVAFSSDNRTIASGSWDKSVRLWDVTRHI
jgi:eukaryotic-like serine/threonine-protein kinase